jgi:hypothetical protein
MRHTREEVIERTIQEYRQLDRVVAKLTPAQWRRKVPRPETKDPWTVKDALVHITHWKADTARSIRGEPRPVEERGLNTTDGNRLVYMRWRRRSPREVLAWHRKVQRDVLATLRAAPAKVFTGKSRAADWPGDLVGHSADHRRKDIERAVSVPKGRA